MTLASCLAVTAIVWTITLIGSVRLRALVYSLPIPMTLVLVFTAVRVDGAQLVGVVLLTAFFAVVAVLHHRYRWPILLADAAGIALYVVLGAVVAHAFAWPLGPTLAGVVAVWLVTNAGVARWSRPSDTAPDSVRGHQRPRLFTLLIVLFGAVLSTALGSLLSGLVVTFPYAGILVAVEARRDLPEFARHFARNSAGLVVFLAVYALTQDRAEWIAIAAGWVAFLCCAALLNLRRLPRPRNSPHPTIG